MRLAKKWALTQLDIKPRVVFAYPGTRYHTRIQSIPVKWRNQSIFDCAFMSIKYAVKLGLCSKVLRIMRIHWHSHTTPICSVCNHAQNLQIFTRCAQKPLVAGAMPETPTSHLKHAGPSQLWGGCEGETICAVISLTVSPGCCNHAMDWQMCKFSGFLRLFSSAYKVR